MKEKNIKFCLNCGLPLLKKWNKMYDEKYADYCNSICKEGRKKKNVSKSKKTSKPKKEHRDLFS